MESVIVITLSISEYSKISVAVQEQFGCDPDPFFADADRDPTHPGPRIRLRETGSVSSVTHPGRFYRSDTIWMQIQF